MSYETLQLEHKGEVATLTLNRPEKRNAISPQMIDDLLVALGAASRPKACVILHGGWRPFTPSCSRRSRSA